MRQGDVLTVSRHPVAFPLYAMAGLDPYRRLRERLGWRGAIEPDVFGTTRPRTTNPTRARAACSERGVRYRTPAPGGVCEGGMKAA